MAVPAPDVAPLGVWDTRKGANDFFLRHRKEISEWAAAHFTRTNAIYRVEFYPGDGPLAVVYRYALNGDGKKYLDEGAQDLATDEPATVALAELPPAHLLAVGNG